MRWQGINAFRAVVRLGLGVLVLASAGSAFAQTGPAATSKPAVKARPVIRDAVKQNQDVQRIVAVVNDEIVSQYDVDLRLNLVLSSTGAFNDPEERRRLRQQILRGLVDEKLQIQEAKDNDIKIKKEDIEKAVTDLGRQNGLERGQFEDYLLSIGTDISTIKQRVKAELSWNEVVGRRLASRLSISDAEVQGVIQRMKASAGEPEYLLAEIYLIIPSPDRAAEVRHTARRLVDQLRNGASFAALARQFSDGATAAVGGDLGWMPSDQLQPEIKKVLEKMPKGRIAEPIETAGGVYIIFMRDRRKVLDVDPMKINLNLSQIVLGIAADALPEEIKALMAMARARAANITSCKDVPKTAQDLGAIDFGNIGNVKLGELPPAISLAVENLKQGQASEPVIRGGKDVRIFVVCARTQPEVKIPDYDTIESQLSRERLALMARRYLRDLRRDAIVDYR